MAIYIDDGVNVNLSWVNHIAVSKDGVNWDTISKDNLNVKSRMVNISNTNKHPYLNKGTHGMITLDVAEDSPLLVFDPNDVVNQVGWHGNTPAALQQAVSDITGWL